MIKIIQQDNVYDNNQELVELIFDREIGRVPFYMNRTTVPDGEYSFFSHSFLSREGVADSAFYDNYMPVFYKFIQDNNITVNKIKRAGINITNADSKGRLFQEPHVDHNDRHYIFLYYINDFEDGSTFIFDKTQYDDSSELTFDKLSILAEIRAKRNRAVCFPGEYFHAQGFCKSGQQRCVLVVTFE